MVVTNSEEPLTKNILSIAVAVLCLILIVLFVGGLEPQGKWILGIIAMTVILWAFSAVDNAAVTLLMLGLLTISGLPLHQVMSGYASGGFWILLTVLYYGYAMSHTGLARRISFFILNLFPPSYTTILFSFLIIGFTLSLGIPSMTARTAIMVPIAWALVQAIGLAPKSAGSALIILTAVEMAVLPGVAFLYGSLWGPVVDRLFSSNNLSLSWFEYARALTFPTFVWCVLLLLVNLWLLRPKEPLRLDSHYFREKLRELGAWKRSEVIVAVLIAGSIVFWALDSYHRLPSYTVGLIIVPLMSLTGIITHKAISTGVPWPLLIFLGGIFSMTEILEENHINTWLAQHLVPLVSPFLENHFALVLMLAFGILLLKFVDPTGFLAVGALFVPLFPLLSDAGIAPLALIATLILPAHPFWVTYQHIWVVMSEGITDHKGFSDKQRVVFSTIYALVTLAILLFCVIYWKWLGFM